MVRRVGLCCASPRLQPPWSVGLHRRKELGGVVRAYGCNGVCVTTPLLEPPGRGFAAHAGDLRGRSGSSRPRGPWGALLLCCGVRSCSVQQRSTRPERSLLRSQTSTSENLENRGNQRSSLGDEKLQSRRYWKESPRTQRFSPSLRRPPTCTWRATPT